MEGPSSEKGRAKINRMLLGWVCLLGRREAGMQSRFRLFGHPVHPMIIAYPVAFYTGTLAAYIVYGANADRFWLKMAIALNIAGVGMAVIAALPGFIDWLLAIPSGHPAKRTGLKHAGLNVISLALFAIALVVYAPKWNVGAPSASTGIILTAIGVGATILAGFQGWKLVQDHHVGVRMETASSERRLKRAS